MKFVASSSPKALPALSRQCVPILLYGRGDPARLATAGAALVEALMAHQVRPARRAWDLLSIALSVFVADSAVLRTTSPDGWTRELDLVADIVLKLRPESASRLIVEAKRWFVWAQHPNPQLPGLSPQVRQSRLQDLGMQIERYLSDPVNRVRIEFKSVLHEEIRLFLENLKQTYKSRLEWTVIP